MSISVNSTQAYTNTKSTSKTNTAAKTEAKESAAASTTASTTTASSTTSASATSDKAAVYEKSKQTTKDSANKIYNKDSIVAKLKADQQSRAASMESLVQKLLGQQAGKASVADELFSLDGNNLAEKFMRAAQNADPETIAQAQKDVADDGYWGVDQTSNRLVSMAIALTGGDTSKADDMMNAIQKGYDKATKAWGKELPDISKKTLEATKQKMDDWKNGKTTAQDYSDYLQ